jgi:chromosomal replication initiator protein
MAENPTHSNNGQELWARVLQNLAQTVDPHSFETWFRPVVFAGLNETSCKLVVPNQFFRRCFLENYSDLLNRTIEQLFKPVEVQVCS